MPVFRLRNRPSNIAKNPSLLLGLCNSCMAVSAPVLLLVAGMHRSGTSLLAHVLQRMGLACPSELVGPCPSNPDGHFEPAFVSQTHERLLVRLQRWWPSAAGTAPMPPGWLDSDPAREAGTALLAWLQQQGASTEGPLMIKDPRLCLVLPLWRRLAAELGWPIQLVINSRSPLQVAASLVERDALVAGMSVQRAYQLWWQHYRTLLLDASDLPVLVTAYEHWFDPHRPQLEHLATFCQVRISADIELPKLRRPQTKPELEPVPQAAHFLFEALNSCSLAPHPNLSSVCAWLETQPSTLSRSIQINPPSHQLDWTFRPILSPQLDCAANLSDWHPWGAAALCCSDGVSHSAAHLLKDWTRAGFSAQVCERLSHLAPPAPAFAFPKDQLTVQLLVLGATTQHWTVQFWLAALAPHLHFQLIHDPADFSPDHPRFALLLGTVFELAEHPQILLQLAALDCVLDPMLSQATLLRALRVPAFHLVAPVLPRELSDQLTPELGLPSPDVLAELGSALVLGPFDDVQPSQADSDQFLHLPDLEGMLAQFNPQLIQQFFHWLHCCQRLGVRLIRTQPSPTELRSSVWKCFHTGREVEIFSFPISISELIQELIWRDAHRPAPDPFVPTPKLEPKQYSVEVFRDVALVEPRSVITVCVSLYNYEQFICRALDSICAQSSHTLQLIVVDDGSTDQGLLSVRSWLDQNSQRFEKALLVRHSSNHGLAAARNTAFSLATTPWCFVLDADNTLDPRAVERCQLLARKSPHDVAVIHPLVRVNHALRSEPSSSSLISGLPWLKKAFVNGNYIDAMALVRRSAWEAVGGYAAIPGGWEDFDFWCQLIDAGYTGQLCPQLLATYHRHDHSMLNRTTRFQIRRISRLLQVRHPWLDLPYARPAS